MRLALLLLALFLTGCVTDTGQPETMERAAFCGDGVCGYGDCAWDCERMCGNGICEKDETANARTQDCTGIR